MLLKLILHILLVAINLGNTKFPEGQCTSFVEQYYIIRKARQIYPLITGNASNWVSGKIPMSTKPSMGDIAVQLGHPGHVSIVLGWDKKDILVLDRNWTRRGKIDIHKIPRIAIYKYLTP